MNNPTETIKEFSELQQQTSTSNVIMAVFFFVFIFVIIYFISSDRSRRIEDQKQRDAERNEQLKQMQASNERYIHQMKREDENRERMFNIIRDTAEATNNSAKAIENSNEITKEVIDVFKDSREVHQVLDAKVTDIYRVLQKNMTKQDLTIDEFKTMIKDVLYKIDELKERI